MAEAYRSHSLDAADGRTPLDELSARRRDLTTHKAHSRQTSMHLAGFEAIVSAGERP